MKTLKLKKDVVEQLSTAEATQVKGGATGTCYASCVQVCIPEHTMVPFCQTGNCA